ncbi:MAG: TetR/AcrR family transcriptional regulator [Rhodanobacteraceae bacterium]
MSREKVAKQARSRATAERLLVAAIRVINKYGVEGATVPRIAETAKVAPASMYRRYADKDALVRAAFVHVLQQSNQNNRQMLRKLLLRETLESTVAQVIAAFFDQYRHHPLLMRSLARYLETTEDQAFVSEARSIGASNVEQVVALLMVHRREIAKADPEHAMRFAVLNAACTVEAYALDTSSLWRAFPEFSSESLARDLTAGFVAYLRSP